MPRAGPSALLLVLLSLAGSAAAESGASVVEGRARMRLRYSEALMVPGYRNHGFEQTTYADHIEILVNATPPLTRARFDRRLQSKGALSDGRATGTDGATSVAEFAWRAVEKAQLQSEAVESLLQAIVARVRYRDGPGLSELPAEVLRTREANCVGLANLSVEALLSIGIQSRIVRGLLYFKDRAQPIPHRWIEVLYPDAGWVFSDPTESVNYVSPYHVVIDLPTDPSRDYDPDSVWRSAPTLLDIDDGLLVVDVRPGRMNRLAERRNLMVQYQAAVRGRTQPPTRGRVRLENANSAFEMIVGSSGEFAFAALDPGRYELTGHFGDRSRRLAIMVTDSEIKHVEVDLR